MQLNPFARSSAHTTRRTFFFFFTAEKAWWQLHFDLSTLHWDWRATESIYNILSPCPLAYKFIKEDFRSLALRRISKWSHMALSIVILNPGHQRLSPIPAKVHAPLLKYMFREAEKSKTNYLATIVSRALQPRDRSTRCPVNRNLGIFFNFPHWFFCSLLDNVDIIVNTICFWKESRGHGTSKIVKSK